MKEQAIQKINKIGKVSSVFALICKILVGIGLAFTLIGMIICFMMPKDLVKITPTGGAEIEIGLDSFGETLILEGDSDEISTQIKDSLMSEDGMENVEVSVADDKINIAGDYKVGTFSLSDLAWILMLAAATLAMTFVTLCFISSLCKAFRDCQSPFEDNVIKKMQNFAYSLIPWALLSTVSNSVSDSFMSNKISLSLTVDLGVVLIVLVVLVLAYIFKYGAVLQQESDETL